MFVSCDKMELCSADGGFCIIKRSKFSRSCEIDKVNLKSSGRDSHFNLRVPLLNKVPP